MFFDINHTIFTSDVDTDTLIDLGLYNSRAESRHFTVFNEYKQTTLLHFAELLTVFQRFQYIFIVNKTVKTYAVKRLMDFTACQPEFPVDLHFATSFL